MNNVFKHCATLGATLAIGLCLAFGVQAQSSAPQTVANVLQQPIYEARVLLDGKVLFHVDGNDFLFEDATGRVLLDGGPPWFHTVDLPLNEPLRIFGKVGFTGHRGSRQQVEIDIIWVERMDGSRLELRSETAPPPWAGGRKNRYPARELNWQKK